MTRMPVEAPIEKGYDSDKPIIFTDKDNKRLGGVVLGDSLSLNSNVLQYQYINSQGVITDKEVDLSALAGSGTVITQDTIEPVSTLLYNITEESSTNSRISNTAITQVKASFNEATAQGVFTNRVSREVDSLSTFSFLRFNMSGEGGFVRPWVAIKQKDLKNYLFFYVGFSDDTSQWIKVLDGVLNEGELHNVYTRLIQTRTSSSAVLDVNIRVWR